MRYSMPLPYNMGDAEEMKNSERKKKAGEAFRTSCISILDKLTPEQAAELDRCNKVPETRKVYRDKQNKWWLEP